VTYSAEMNGDKDILWMTELESVFAFPTHYTNVGNLALRNRKQILLRSRKSVTVLKGILEPIKAYLSLERNLDDIEE
jgi:hypothetical protein